MHSAWHVPYHRGGLLNLKRLTSFGFQVDTPIIPMEIFSWIQKTGDISTIEMYRTFNMGMGYAYIVPPASVAGIKKVVKGAKVIGVITDEPGVWLGDIEIT